MATLLLCQQQLYGVTYGIAHQFTHSVIIKQSLMSSVNLLLTPTSCTSCVACILSVQLPGSQSTAAGALSRDDRDLFRSLHSQAAAKPNLVPPQLIRLLILDCPVCAWRNLFAAYAQKDSVYSEIIQILPAPVIFSFVIRLKLNLSLSVNISCAYNMSLTFPCNS